MMVISESSHGTVAQPAWKSQTAREHAQKAPERVIRMIMWCLSYDDRGGWGVVMVVSFMMMMIRGRGRVIGLGWELLLLLVVGVGSWGRRGVTFVELGVGWQVGHVGWQRQQSTEYLNEDRFFLGPFRACQIGTNRVGGIIIK